MGREPCPILPPAKPLAGRAASAVVEGNAQAVQLAPLPFIQPIKNPCLLLGKRAVRQREALSTEPRCQLQVF